jgi:hypothetical protein
VMPTFFCNQLVALQELDDQISIEVYKGMLVAVFSDGTMLFTKTIADMEPSDFKRVVQKYIGNGDFKSYPIPDTFDMAIERALLVQFADKSKSTEFSVVNKKLTIQTNAQGNSTDEMTYSGEDVTFMIDPSRIKKITPITTQMALLPDVMVLSDDTLDFLHLIAHIGAK